MKLTTTLLATSALAITASATFAGGHMADEMTVVSWGGAYQVSQNPANFYVLLGMFPLRVSFLPSRQGYNRDLF